MKEAKYDMLKSDNDTMSPTEVIDGFVLKNRINDCTVEIISTPDPNN